MVTDSASMVEVIPGIPNDIAVQCLLRLPHVAHTHARLVCKTWNNLISSPLYYALRQLNGVADAWLYVLSREPSERMKWWALDLQSMTWRVVARMPRAVGRGFGITCHAGSNSSRIIAAGGADWTCPPHNEVYRYNPLSNFWDEMPPLNVGRCYAVSGVVGNKLIVAGGLGDSGSLSSTEVFDPINDIWREGSNMLCDSDIQDSVVWNGKLYISHVRCEHFVPGPTVQFFDPLTESWAWVEDEMAQGWVGPCTELNGVLYMVDQTNGLRIMSYDVESRRWNHIGRLCAISLSAPYKLASFNGKLYIVGRGCGTVEVDVSQIEKQSGYIVAKAVKGTGLGTASVLGCYVLCI